MAAFETMAVRFWGVRNWGDRTAKAPPSKIRKATTPLTRSRNAKLPSERCGARAVRLGGGIDGPSRFARSRHHHGFLGGVAGVQIGDDAALGHNQDAVG